MPETSEEMAFEIEALAMKLNAVVPEGFHTGVVLGALSTLIGCAIRVSDPSQKRDMERDCIKLIKTLGRAPPPEPPEAH